MSAQLYQIRDYQLKRRIEELDKMAKELFPQIAVKYPDMIPPYQAPDKDPA